MKSIGFNLKISNEKTNLIKALSRNVSERLEKSSQKVVKLFTKFLNML
ncbi:TPA: hypothetical protein ACIZWK_001971 [Streptococcus agalactiae]